MSPQNITTDQQSVDQIEKRLESFETELNGGKSLIQAVKWTETILQEENDASESSEELDKEKDSVEEGEEEEEGAEEEDEEEEEAEDQEEAEGEEKEKEKAEEDQQEKKQAADEQYQKDLAEEQKRKEEVIEKQKAEDNQKSKDTKDQTKLKKEKEKASKEKTKGSEKLKEVKKGELVKNLIPTNSTVNQASPKPKPEAVVHTGISTSTAASDSSTSSNAYSANSSQSSSFENHQHASHQGKSDSERWLALHNSVRNKYFTPPVQWSEELSAIAKKVSETCVFEHSDGDTGENIAAGEMDLEQVVDDWAFGNDESSVYDPQNPIYSHFTQIVWKRTTHIGCAYTDCETIQEVPWTGQSKFWVCEYNPPGNYAGEFISNEFYEQYDLRTLMIVNRSS
ncbi:CAP domain-containing protein [Melampsora americana]|nr:CAP domain-containing protein [Melampsora americana]